MPSFDVVSEVDSHELTNAVDQASRELAQRFDFKETGSEFELDDLTVTMSAPAEFQLKQMLEILKDAKLKVQAQIQGEKVRVTGKKRDDLQEAIALLRKGAFEVPLQFNNFRD